MNVFIGVTFQLLFVCGKRIYDVDGLPELLDAGFKNGRELKVKVKGADGKTKEVTATVRIDTPQEILYYKNGGILPYVLRQLLRSSKGKG